MPQIAAASAVSPAQGIAMPRRRELGQGAVLSDVAERIGVDVVIVGTPAPEDMTIPARLIAALPRTRVLMLCIAGRRAVMYEMRPHRTALDEASPQALIDAIRAPVLGYAAWQWRGEQCS